MTGFRLGSLNVVRSQLRRGGIPILLASGVVVLAMVAAAPDAQAVPSFARQTGLACSSCHTTFPELTSLGRDFKINGYTLVNMGTIEQQAKPKTPELSINKVFPLAVMFQTSLSRTNEKQPGTQNNDIEFPQQLSLFLAGEITPHVGTFVQTTYTGTDDHITLDNTDIRYANQATIAGTPLTYGVTANNNPTVEDPWNSTPAWGYPFAGSDSAATPAAATLIDGTLGQQVAGLGAYGFLDQHLYGDVTLYRSAQIGGPQPPDSTAADVIDGLAPYWRLAWQQDFGHNYLEVGTYGMYAQMYPMGVSGMTDKYADIAFDAQYERAFGPDSISAHATYIYENQRLNATHFLGNSSNVNDKLRTFRIDGIYHWHRRVALSLGYFQTHGTTDMGLYNTGDAVTGSINGSPDSSGGNVVVSYYPWQNLRLSVGYTAYSRFNGRTTNYDGTGRDASANDTLYVLAWLMY